MPAVTRPAIASMADTANRFARGWKIAAIADAMDPRRTTHRVDYEQRRMRLHVGAQGIEIAPAVRAYIKGQST
jgi:hypothetical protein